MTARALRIFAFCLLLAAVCTGARADEKQMEDTNTVVLRTIDKLSARTHTFDIPVDKTVKFGNSLFIKARACRKSSPLDLPESSAFLQIWERKPAEQKSRWLFSGWMFASSPSLSRLDHPVYDVWVIDCKNAATSKSEVFSSETAPNGAPNAAKPVSDGKTDAAAEKGASPVTPATEPKSDSKLILKPEPKPAADTQPAAEPEPAVEDEPAEASPDADEPATPATDKPAAPAAKPESKPADKTPPAAPGAKPAVPPLDKLPGSFEDGKEDLPSGGD